MCVRNGSKKLVGKTALIKKSDLCHTWGAFMMIILTHSDNHFIYHYLNSDVFCSQMFPDVNTATIAQITKGMLNKCREGQFDEATTSDYQLSHAIKIFCSDAFGQFDNPTKVFYRLSHATLFLLRGMSFSWISGRSQHRSTEDRKPPPYLLTV